MNALFNAPKVVWTGHFFVWMCLISGQLVMAQNYAVRLIPDDSTARHILQNEMMPTDSLDSLACHKYLRQFIENQQDKGFFTATFDSIFFHKNQCQVHFVGGKKYPKIRLRQSNISAKSWRKIGLSKPSFPSSLSPFALRQFQYQILEFYENHGYPFANIYLDSIQFLDDQFSGNLHLDSGQFVRFDSAIFLGDKTLKIKFLESYLKIPKGRAFAQNLTSSFEDKLTHLPYLELTAPMRIIFTQNKAHPVFFIQKKPINEFSGVIGFLPNASASETDQKLRVIGNLNLKLHHAFGRGMLIRMALQIPKPRSRTLDAELEYPNLLRTNIDMNLKINLFSEDTLFSNWQQKYTLKYDAGKGKKIGLFWLRQIATPTDSLFLINEVLARISETNYSAYGIQYIQQKLDKLFTPQKGFQIMSEIMFGNKKSALQLLNATPTETNQNSVQWIVRAELHKFFKIGKQTTFLVQTKSGMILNNNLFINELFRLGGFQHLRGFNENEFFASRYWLYTLEYRLYFGQNSSVFAFFDSGFLSYKLDHQVFNDNPYGLGVGFMVGTKSGIFNFAYALGKSNTQQIRMAQSKIHFGYVNRF